MLTQVRTSPSVPWDVPVRIVPMPPMPPTTTAGTEAGTAPERVRRVDVGVDLPGVQAVEVVTRDVADVGPGSGATVITDVRPVRAMDARSGPRVDGTLRGLLEELRVEGPDGSAVLVAVDGTAFVRDVLAALARVPVGTRRTYAGLAADAGRPRAVRAVASVMARNRVPLVLPCHRIVPTGDAGVGRYAWGPDVKAALLDAESRTADGRA